VSAEDVQDAVAAPSPVTVTADFAAPVDYPLSKEKFAVYNSGLVTLDRYRRDAERFAEVGPESLRIDIAWGWPPGEDPYAVQPVTGTADQPVYHFDELDELAVLLNSQGVLPYWSYCYMPVPLQREGDWRSAPASMEAWERVLRAFARHYRDAGIRIGYHEVYNEPDLVDPSAGPIFFTGTRDEYFEMYRRGAPGLKAGDPDAVVGGPALAVTGEGSWFADFLAHVRAHDLPLDFASFHHYGPGVGEAVERMRDGLSRDPRFAATDLHLNEYNALPIDYPPGGPQEKHGQAAALLQDFHDLLGYPYLTKVSWAQFLDSGHDNYSGMVSIDGRRKAVFNAYKIYMTMPTDRRRVGIAAPVGNGGIGGMAATDGHRAGIVVWNRSGAERIVTVALRDIPFPRGAFRVYRIDADHASWGDNLATEALTATETRDDVDTAALAWAGAIPRDAAVYLEVDDGSGISETPPHPVAAVVRTLRHYPDRMRTAYADFDTHTWIARLGMVTERQALAQVGVTVEDLPDILALHFMVDGALRPIDEDSLLGVRIDYQADGTYAWSVLFHGPYAGSPDLYDARGSAPLPWGTGRPPDRVVAVADLARFDIPVTASAPEAWTGRAQLTFIARNAGVGVRAKVTVRAG